MRRGAPWGHPAAGPADVLVRGTDADVADAVGAHPGALVALDPASASDVGRAVGVGGHAPVGTTELHLDAIAVDAVVTDGDRHTSFLAVNVVVLGTPPDRLTRRHRRSPVTVRVDGRPCFEGRATTVVIATGQYLRGADLVPRGHPGDGRVEVQVYALAPGQRHGMRQRLTGGTHVPHPGIRETSGRRVEVSAPSGWPLEVDGRSRGAHGGLEATVRADAWRLLV
jgi:diacylglycerol kinase family enzyme